MRWPQFSENSIAAPWGKNVWLCLSLVLLIGCSRSPTSDTAAAAPTEKVDFAAVRAAAEQAYNDSKWREAGVHYERLVRETPQDAVYWFRLGNIYARTERPDLATSAYREALVRDADNAKAWFNMGVVQLRQAANSFLKMEVHVRESDPYAAQGRKAYETIMGLLGVDPQAPRVATQTESAVATDSETAQTSVSVQPPDQDTETNVAVTAIPGRSDATVAAEAIPAADLNQDAIVQGNAVATDAAGTDESGPQAGEQLAVPSAATTSVDRTESGNEDKSAGDDGHVVYYPQD